MYPLGVPNYPWKIVGLDFVTDLPKSSKYNFTAILILVCHLTKRAHFVPSHTDITVEETADLFIDNYYKLMVFPKSLYFIGIADLLANYGKHLRGS